MDIKPVDLTEMLGVVMGISIVLIPIMAIATRFAFKPLFEALMKLWATRDGVERISVLERRVAMLERQLELGGDLATISHSLATSRSQQAVD